MSDMVLPDGKRYLKDVDKNTFDLKMKILSFLIEALFKSKRTARFRRYAFFVNKTEICSLWRAT
jgi:hypothetical protein